MLARLNTNTALALDLTGLQDSIKSTPNHPVILVCVH